MRARGERGFETEEAKGGDGETGKAGEATQAAALSCVQCERVGQHVCVWSWRGVVLLLALTCAASVVVSALQASWLLSSLYSLLFVSSLTLLFYVQSLSASDGERFLASFPSRLTHSLFAVVSLQSLYAGLAQPFSSFFGCLAVIALATFLSSTADAVKFYFLSLLLSSAVYCRSFFASNAFASALPLASPEDEALAVDFLREQFIFYTPLFLSLHTLLLVVLQQWWAHTASLLTTSISRHKALKDAAMSASKLKSEFLANVSHDIRTPMNSILGFLQLAVGDRGLSDETRECVQTAFTSAEDLLSLLNDLLDISKIESGNLRFEAIDFSLQAVYEKAVKTFAAQAQKKGVELIYEVDPLLHSAPFATVKGDPSRLAQVVNNLLSNAVKFTSPKASCEHSEIVVRVSLLPSIQPGFVHIHTAVSDTGEGISSAGLARIFQPFIQADMSVNRRHGSTGLGLAISAELVKLSGGRIWCQSEVGRGSCFFFTAQFQQVGDLASDPQQSELDVFSSLQPDVRLLDNPAHPAVALQGESGLGSHAVSEPLPCRRVESETKVKELRVLLAVHNPVNADVLSRAITQWMRSECHDCTTTTPCGQCSGSRPFSLHTASHSSHPLPGTGSPASAASHRPAFIEVVPTARVSTDYVVQEALWAKTTRQPYDLLVLDESAPAIDTVRVLQQLQKRRITQTGKPGVLILTTRLLAPVLRGNGSSTYVLISKPVLHAEINSALSLLLRSAPEQPKSLPLAHRRLDSAQPALHHPGAAQAEAPLFPQPHRYVNSSRCPKDGADDDDEPSLPSSTASGTPAPVETGKGQLHIDPALIVSSASEDKALREPYMLVREDHPSSQHSTSAPNSPTGQQALAAPTPASAPLDGAASVYQPPQALPAAQAMTWDGRAQSFPDFFFPTSAINASQSLTSSPAPTSKPRSRSMSNTLPPAEAAPAAVTTAEATAEVATEAPVEAPAQALPSPKPTIDTQMAALQPMAEPQSGSAQLGSADSATLGFTSRSASASSLTSPPTSNVNSPMARAASRTKPSVLNGAQRDGAWPASPPRHHVDAERLTRSTAPTVRRLLPTNQAVANIMAGELVTSRVPTLSSSTRGRTPSSPLSLTQPGLRSSSSTTDTSPQLLSGGHSPVSGAGEPFGTPESASPAQSTASPALGSPHPRLSPYRQTVHVLCVDDNSINLKVASKMLQRLGYTPHTLRSGEEAIAFLDQMRDASQPGALKEGEYPELIRGPSAEEDSRRREAMDVSRWIVLMDVIMDGMNGMEATKVIRSRGHRMPIFALTANVMQEDKDKAKASGMDGFIEKPLRLQELEAAIKTALEQQQRQLDA